jgi:hypothetical protein
VLRFAYRDPEQTTTAEWSALGDELVMLSYAVLAEGDADATFSVPPSPPTIDAVRDVRRRLRQVFDDIAAHREVKVPSPGEWMQWPRPAEGDKDPDRMYVRFLSELRGLEDTTLASIRKLVEVVRPRLRRRPECGHPFVAHRRQRRHPSCAWKARARTRQAKRDKLRKRPKKGA